MYTLGRSREKANAIRQLKTPRHGRVVHQIVDAAHDLLEMTEPEQKVRLSLLQYFTTGPTDVWRCSGLWLGQLSRHYPTIAALWLELATHESVKVRARTAACLCHLPDRVTIPVAERLLVDRSAKIRSQTAAQLAELPDARAASLLATRLPSERDARVAENIKLGLEQIQRLLSTRQTLLG